MKFLFECTLSEVFEDADGWCVGVKGETLNGVYHGAFFRRIQTAFQ